jgi:hypothetical protein
MRFLHSDIAPVLDHLERERCRIEMLEWEREPTDGGFAFLGFARKRRAAHPARRVGTEEVAYFGRRGRDPTHAGTVLRHYFHVNSTATGRPLSLVEAVEQVEAAGAEDEFVLAGYPEGGLISVSRRLLGFQRGLAAIDWWGP